MRSSLRAEKLVHGVHGIAWRKGWLGMDIQYLDA